MVDSWTSASLIENKYRVRYGWTVCNGKMEWNFGWRQRATESISRYLIILRWCHCLSYGKGYIEISTFLISNILWLTFGLLVGIWSRCWVWVYVCVCQRMRIAPINRMFMWFQSLNCFFGFLSHRIHIRKFVWFHHLDAGGSRTNTLSWWNHTHTLDDKTETTITKK